MFLLRESTLVLLKFTLAPRLDRRNIKNVTEPVAVLSWSAGLLKLCHD